MSIPRRSIIFFTEFHSGRIKPVRKKFVSGIFIKSDFVKVVITLKNLMMKNHPMQIITDVRPDHGRRNFGVIDVGKIRTNVMKERRKYILIAAVVSKGAGRRLKAMA